MRIEPVGYIGADTVVSLTDIKRHVVVEHDVDDDLLTDYLNAAIDYCQKYISQPLVLTRYTVTLDCFQAFGVPYAPLRAIEAVQYLDGDELTQTLSTDSWRVSQYTRRPEMRFYDPLPTLADKAVGRVFVTFVAGYGAYSPESGYGSGYPVLYGENDDPAYEVPNTVKQAIRLMVGDFYANREIQASGKLVDTVQSLLYQERAGIGV